MLDFAYLFFILLLILYMMIARRKELPFVVISHAVVQYFFTTLSWMGMMDRQIAGVLLLFLAASSCLLIWARQLNYSKESKMIQIFVNLSQWAILLILIGFFAFKPNYILHYSTFGNNPHLGLIYSYIPPFFKLFGNLLMFTTYLLFILNWGNTWDVKKSLKNFSPIFIYLFLLSLLYILGTSLRSQAYT